jgi:co-chaperonin GroES (HSP10)
VINPLGNQLIIRTIPQESWRGIVIPQTARGATITGDKGAEDAAHFVEAEVIAVGPGKRRKGDPDVIAEIAHMLRCFIGQTDARLPLPGMVDQCRALIERAENRTAFLEPFVKPGDRVLYHPAVQKFDRQIDGAMIGYEDGFDYFIVGEHSIMAVIER